MKKIMMLVICMILLINESDAFRIGGVEFSWKRGKPEWNATKTDVFCVGKGMCSGTIKITGDVGLTKTPDGEENYDDEQNLYASNLVNYNGKLAIEISRGYYLKFTEDFKNGLFDINGDIVIDPKVSRLLNLTNIGIIKSGTYPLVKDTKTGAYLVVLN